MFPNRPVMPAGLRTPSPFWDPLGVLILRRVVAVVWRARRLRRARAARLALFAKRCEPQAFTFAPSFGGRVTWRL